MQLINRAISESVAHACWLKMFHGTIVRDNMRLNKLAACHVAWQIETVCRKVKDRPDVAFSARVARRVFAVATFILLANARFAALKG